MSQHKKEVEKQKDIEANVVPAPKEKSAKQSLSLNKESKGFGSKEHIEDIKERQANNGEVSFDEEQLLLHQV